MSNDYAACALGLDIGGASTVAGVLRRDGALLSRASMPTESQRGITDGLQRLVVLVEDVMADAGISRRSIVGIGIGASAPVDKVNGVINNPYTLPRWDGIPVGAHLSQYFGVPVRLIGDCDAAALGEHWIGAGRGARNVIYITVGTGVGGGVVIEGKLHQGVASATCEVGHMVIDASGPECYCGARGCLEMFAAAPAIVKRAQIAWDSTPVLRQLCEGDPQRITAKLVYDAAKQGDEAALCVMREAGRALGIGVANLMNLLAPYKIILGGGVMQGWDLIAPAMFEVIRSRATMAPFDHIEIVPAALGLNAGITGAARAIFDR